MKMIRSSSRNSVHTSHTDTQTNIQFQLLHGWGAWGGVAILGGKQMGHKDPQASAGHQAQNNELRAQARSMHAMSEQFRYESEHSSGLRY